MKQLETIAINREGACFTTSSFLDAVHQWLTEYSSSYLARQVKEKKDPADFHKCPSGLLVRQTRLLQAIVFPTDEDVRYAAGEHVGELVDLERPLNPPLTYLAGLAYHAHLSHLGVHTSHGIIPLEFYVNRDDIRDSPKFVPSRESRTDLLFPKLFAYADWFVMVGQCGYATKPAPTTV